MIPAVKSCLSSIPGSAGTVEVHCGFSAIDEQGSPFVCRTTIIYTPDESVITETSLKTYFDEWKTARRVSRESLPVAIGADLIDALSPHAITVRVETGFDVGMEHIVQWMWQRQEHAFHGAPQQPEQPQFPEPMQ